MFQCWRLCHCCRCCCCCHSRSSSSSSTLVLLGRRLSCAGWRCWWCTNKGCRNNRWVAVFLEVLRVLSVAVDAIRAHRQVIVCRCCCCHCWQNWLWCHCHWCNRSNRSNCNWRHWRSRSRFNRPTSFGWHGRRLTQSVVHRKRDKKRNTKCYGKNQGKKRERKKSKKERKKKKPSRVH